MSKPFIYSAKNIIPQDVKIEGLTYKIWRPSFNIPKPPGKPKKYIIYYIFHILGIFKNRDYCSILVYDKDDLVASLLIVPKYFKWPFMNKDDLQFTYVKTVPRMRGLNIASKMIYAGYEVMKNRNRRYWYVTTEENIISQKLAKKVGFFKIGDGVRTMFKLILAKTEK